MVVFIAENKLLLVLNVDDTELALGVLLKLVEKLIPDKLTVCKELNNVEFCFNKSVLVLPTLSNACVVKRSPLILDTFVVMNVCTEALNILFTATDWFTLYDVTVIEESLSVSDENFVAKTFLTWLVAFKIIDEVTDILDEISEKTDTLSLLENTSLSENVSLTNIPEWLVESSWTLWRVVTISAELELALPT